MALVLKKEEEDEDEDNRKYRINRSMLVVPRGVQWGGGEGEYGRDGANVVETTEAVQGGRNVSRVR